MTGTTLGRFVATTLVCFLVLYVTIRGRGPPEGFSVLSSNADIDYSNSGPDPWNHHQVTGSIPLDLVPKSNRPYYYEFDNAEYDTALKDTFKYPCAHAADILKVTDWIIVDLSADSEARSEVATAYDKTITYIAEKVNASEYLQLPYDNPNKRPAIQVVHDVIVQAKKHVRDNFKYVLSIEIILYRESKFHGKHVSMTSITTYDPNKKKWNFYIVEVNVLGIVYEDQIGMFPVVANYDQPIVGVSFDTLLESTPIIPNDEVTRTIVSKQNRNVATDISVNQKLSLSGSSP